MSFVFSVLNLYMWMVTLNRYSYMPMEHWDTSKVNKCFSAPPSSNIWGSDNLTRLSLKSLFLFDKHHLDAQIINRNGIVCSPMASSSSCPVTGPSQVLGSYLWDERKLSLRIQVISEDKKMNMTHLFFYQQRIPTQHWSRWRAGRLTWQRWRAYQGRFPWGGDSWDILL